MSLTAKFNGSHIGSITQNRVVLPKPFKEVLNSYPTDKIVVTFNPNGCLVLYPKAGYEDACDVLENSDKDVDTHMLFLWEHYSMGVQTLEGSAGRFRISAELMDKAKITDKVKFVGRGNFVSLWSVEVFEEYERSIEEKFKNTTEIEAFLSLLQK